MEVDVTDGTDLGFNGLVRVINGDNDYHRSARSSDSATARTRARSAARPRRRARSSTPQLLQNLLTAAAGSSFVAGGNSRPATR